MRPVCDITPQIGHCTQLFHAFHLDSGLCLGGRKPIGENLFSFFFFFFSSVTCGIITLDTCRWLGAPEEVDANDADAAATGGGAFPDAKFNQEFTRPCLESSQFLANSFSAFLFSPCT